MAPKKIAFTLASRTSRPELIDDIGIAKAAFAKIPLALALEVIPEVLIESKVPLTPIFLGQFVSCPDDFGLCQSKGV
jgi:hypothetical protein